MWDGLCSSPLLPLQRGIPSAEAQEAACPGVIAVPRGDFSARGEQHAVVQRFAAREGPACSYHCVEVARSHPAGEAASPTDTCAGHHLTGELIRKLPLSVLAAIKTPAPCSDSANRVAAPKMPFPGGGRTRQSTGLGWSRATACPRASPARPCGTALPFWLGREVLRCVEGREANNSDDR